MLLAALSPATWYNIGLVVVLISLVVAGILAFRVWREVNEDIEPATTEELLESFDQARAEGDLDDEEYARVRKRIEEGPGRTPDPPQHRGEGEAPA